MIGKPDCLGWNPNFPTYLLVLSYVACRCLLFFSIYNREVIIGPHSTVVKIKRVNADKALRVLLATVTIGVVFGPMFTPMERCTQVPVS